MPPLAPSNAVQWLLAALAIAVFLIPRFSPEPEVKPPQEDDTADIVTPDNDVDFVPPEPEVSPVIQRDDLDLAFSRYRARLGVTLKRLASAGYQQNFKNKETTEAFLKGDEKNNIGGVEGSFNEFFSPVSRKIMESTDFEATGQALIDREYFIKGGVSE